MTHYCTACGRWQLLDAASFLCGLCLAAWQETRSGHPASQALGGFRFGIPLHRRLAQV